MVTQADNVDRLKDDLHIRDAIIHALYLRLKSERETREAVIDAVRSGAAPEVLDAIASDPIPLIDEAGQDAIVSALVKKFSEGHLAISPIKTIRHKVAGNGC